MIGGGVGIVMLGWGMHCNVGVWFGVCNVGSLVMFGEGVGIVMLREGWVL